MAITIDGSTGVQLDDNDKQEFGNSADLKIFHDGSNSYIKDAGTGQLDISSDKVWISGSNNESMADFTENGAVQLYYNNSKKFQTESYGNQAFGEFFIGDGDGSDASNHIRLGNGGDLKIFHDGSNSVIKDAGTGLLAILSSALNITDSSGAEDGIKFVEHGAVSLYYDNSLKLHTHADGVKLNDTTYLPDNKQLMFGGGNDFRILHTGGAHN